MSSPKPLQAHLVRECAQWVKYVIDLPEPLSLEQYHHLSKRLNADLNDIWLPKAGILFQLRLPESKGKLSGSNSEPTLHAFLAKREHANLLSVTLSHLRSILEG